MCLGGFPSLCNPDSWVASGVFWKDRTVTSCVPLSNGVQSAKLLSRWLYLILVHLHLQWLPGCPVRSGFGCRSKVGTELCIPPVLWSFPCSTLSRRSTCPGHGSIFSWFPGPLPYGFGTHLMTSFSQQPLLLYVRPLGS